MEAISFPSPSSITRGILASVRTCGRSSGRLRGSGSLCTASSDSVRRSRGTGGVGARGGRGSDHWEDEPHQKVIS